MARPSLLILAMVAAVATSGLDAADDDPPRAWAMYFGGSAFDAAGAIATTANGDSYVIRASSSDASGSSLLKFNSAGTLIYAVGVGAIAHDVAVSADGSAFVVASDGSLRDVFVTRVSPAGTTAYVTTIPGMKLDLSQIEKPAIAAGASGTVVVAGRTDSASVGIPQTTIGPLGGGDALVVTLDAGGVATSATLFGGSDYDVAIDVAVDTAGSVDVVGRTRSPEFPVSGGAGRPTYEAGTCARPQTQRCDEAFLVVLGTRGDVPLATYFGGGGADLATGVAVDSRGGVYVVGRTSSRDFPVVRAVQPTARYCPPNLVAGCSAPFVVRYERSGSIAFATYLSGTLSTEIVDVSVDGAGNAYVAGTDRGNDFPMRRAPQPDNGGGPIVVSEDGSRTWSAPGGLRASAVEAIAWSSDARPTVYAASDRGLFVSADYGRHWTEAAAFADRRMTAVAVDPVSSGIVFAGVATEGEYEMHPGRRGGLFKSLDGGQTWVDVSGGLSDVARGYIPSIAIAPSLPSTIYITGGGMHVYASDDGGSTWRGGTESGNSVGVDPTNASRVYTIASSGIKISTDGGRTWRTTAAPSTIGYPDRVGAIVVNRAQPSHVYVGLDKGVARSRDAGESWELIRTGSSEQYVHSVTIDPTAPGEVWAAVRGGVFRMAVGDSTFSVVDRRFRFGELISKHSGRLLHSARWLLNGFLTAFDASGAMLWSTYIGGNGPDVATGVSAEAGSVYVSGTTQSEIWPLAQAGPRPHAGGADVFVARYTIPGSGPTTRRP